MEWKWNGRKLPVWNMEKSSSIPFHTMPWFLVTCQHQATASDLSFYDIFAPTKNSSFEVSDDVIACDLWFAPPPIKNPGYAYVPPLTTACAPTPFRFTENTFLEHIVEKGIVMFKQNSRFEVLSILCKIAGKQLPYIIVRQQSVLIYTSLRMYRGKRDVSLQSRFWYFVSDYDLK